MMGMLGPSCFTTRAMRMEYKLRVGLNNGPTFFIFSLDPTIVEDGMQGVLANHYLKFRAPIKGVKKIQVKRNKNS